MDIPAHRAAAVVPTPAHTFELREDGQLVSLTEEERTAVETADAAAVPASSAGGDQPTAPTKEERTAADAVAADAVPLSSTESDQPATPTEEEQAAADAAAVPVRAPKGRRPATDAPAQSAQTAE